MPKYSDKPCARCGKMMLHAYCSTRYCKACAPLVRSDNAIISQAKQRSKRAMSEIARVERAARAEGKTCTSRGRGDADEQTALWLVGICKRYYPPLPCPLCAGSRPA